MAATRESSPVRRGASLSRFRRARRLSFYVCVRALVFCVEHAPRWVGSSALRGLGQLAWWTRPGDRTRAVRQIALAFPDRASAWHRALARAALTGLAANLVDMVRSDGRPLLVDEEARLRVDAVRAAGRPVLVLMAHLGAWERLGPWLARELPPFAAITADPHNARVDRWLRRRRAAVGVQSFDRRREATAAARWLRRGGTLAVLADHRSSVSTVTAPWFGRPAPTPVGPVRLARWSGALVLPVGIRREGGTHRVMVAEAFAVESAWTDERAAMEANRALEEFVLRAPEEWTWFHDRYGGDALANVPLPDGAKAREAVASAPAADDASARRLR